MTPLAPGKKARWIVAATLAAVSAFRLSALAQNPDDDDSPPPAVVAPVNNFMIGDQNFEHSIFGTYLTVDVARARFHLRFESLADEFERVCGLTAAQKAKIRLAAEGDIKRFFESVDAKRKEFQVAKTDMQKYQDFYQSVTPLRLAFQQGLLGDESLVARTLKTTLDADQTARYKDVGRERRAFRNAARLELSVGLLDQVLGLNADQRRQVRKILREKTKPTLNSGNMDYYSLLFQLSRLPEETLKPIFRESQWQILSSRFLNVRGMELYLSKNGGLPGPNDPGYDPEPTPDDAHKPKP